MQLHLKRLSWREYLRRDNPVVAALLSRMDYSEDEKKQLKKEFFRMILRLELDEARMELLTTFMETYVKLPSEEDDKLKEELKEELSPGEVNKLEEMVTSWERRGIEKGREEGREQGKEQGREEGREDAMLKIARNMLEEGYGVKEIVKLTGLTEEKIQQIKKEQ